MMANEVVVHELIYEDEDNMIVINDDNVEANEDTEEVETDINSGEIEKIS